MNERDDAFSKFHNLGEENIREHIDVVFNSIRNIVENNDRKEFYGLFIQSLEISKRDPDNRSRTDMEIFNLVIVGFDVLMGAVDMYGPGGALDHGSAVILSQECPEIAGPNRKFFREIFAYYPASVRAN